MIQPMRVAVFTTLYPNAANPTHGVFVENRLRAVLDREKIDIRVIAPVPWFPFPQKIFGQYGQFARAPKRETRHGIEVSHPRYPLPPKVGMSWAPVALARCFGRELDRLANAGWKPDLIDAHYFYPDGVAAARVAEARRLPLLITARGTDINLIPDFPRQRGMILDAARTANQSITVCSALREEMIRLGANPETITVLRNGVDLELFCPRARTAARERLGVEGSVLLSAGHLIDRKGHDLVIEALTELPGVTLLIAGDGPEEASLRALATRKNVADRVRFLGRLPHDSLPEVYAAADLLVLASSREGWPNVLLEAMACGTPAVAAPVWGTGEVIAAPAAGALAPERTSGALAGTIRDILAAPPPRTDTRSYAEQFSWKETADGVLTQFRRAIKNGPIPAAQANWHAGKPFHLPGKEPKLLVTVDTEEIFNWDSSTFDDWRLAPPADINLFQKLCERHGVKPLYFLTLPLIEDEIVGDYYKALSKEGRASLGLHLHQWVTPPAAPFNTPYTSYQCNLDPQLHAAKLDRLAAAFKTRFGFAPIAHRAGRYGVSPAVHDQLAARGIRFDFSPSAAFDLRLDGGPDFSGTTGHAWTRDTSAGPALLCVPVSGKRFYRKSHRFLRQQESRTGDFTPLSPALKLATSSIRLTPEGFPLDMLQRTSQSLLQDRIRLQSFSLHSTSLTPGATVYAGDSAGRDALLQRTDEFFTWFTKDFKGRFTSLDELDAAFPAKS